MASNINVVAGTRSARAKDAAATDPGEYQRQLDIAKDIALDVNLTTRVSELFKSS